jgi:hypothetical protein
MTSANAEAAPGTSVLKTIVLATLVAGTLDIAYAIISSALLRGVAPMVILQSVASGLLGKASYEGGAGTAVLGGLLHYGIMAGAVVVFWLASRRWTQLVQRPLLWGPAFGAGVFVVMNYVVVPLSAIGHTFQRTPPRFAAEFCVHLFLVGLPIAWFLSRASRRN